MTREEIKKALNEEAKEAVRKLTQLKNDEERLKHQIEQAQIYADAAQTMSMRFIV